MKTPDRTETLLFGETYHIYNKAVGSDLLFKTEKDYFYFLKKAERFILPISKIYAYCLIPNHFHFLLSIKEIDEIQPEKGIQTEFQINRAFANFFISYARSYNKIHFRQGRLFFQTFKRILIDDEDYFMLLVNYIHRNPIHHGLVKDHREWKYSSYNAFLSNKETKVRRKEVLEYFYSLDGFIKFHQENKTVEGGGKYLLE